MNEVVQVPAPAAHPRHRPPIHGLCATLNRVLRGKPEVIEYVLACLLARGHLLLEDLPGLGKTTLAKALANAIGGSFARVQCTPDLLPGDITGFSIFNQKTREFEFLPGPVFADVLLADEINRATPRTQSALLEAMGERQVTVDNAQHTLAATFFVIATQNPVEHHGTYPLPEAQLDRFTMKLSIGYPERDDELELLAEAVGELSGLRRAEPVALSGLALLLLLGAVVQKFDRRHRIEAFLVIQPPPSDRPVAIWNRHVPGPVLGMLALLGLVLFSVVALYIYYPAPKEAFDEIFRVRGAALAAVQTGHKEEAVRQIQHWDLLTRKLQVGVFIRTGRMNPEATQATEDLRERLEELRDALLADNLAEAKEMVPKVDKAYRHCRSSYETDTRNE